MSEPPLVAHVIHHLAMGGLENGLVNLINHIPADRYRHCVICVEDFSDFRHRIARPEVEVHAMHKSRLSTIQLYRRLFALFKNMRPAIVHSRNLSGLDALLPAYAANVPVRIHGEHGWDVHDLDGARVMPRLLRRLHSPLVHRYVTVSRDLEKYLTEKIGVPPSRITQIYNGVDTRRFAPSQIKPAGIMPPRFYGADKLVVGTVGRLQAVKDQITLVLAFTHLLRNDPSLRQVLRLVIVGDGPERASLLACINQHGLADVTWVPGSRDDLHGVYQCLDLFVLTSLREGVSNTLLEAMATGLPVIVTAVGGNVELVADDVNGRLVPISNPSVLAAAIGQYLASVALRSRHSEASRLRAQNDFSIDLMVDSYVRLYDSLCAKRPQYRL
jgi:sugar transferase (PEP-CTERM/EpsH1 system associated)